MLTAEKFENTDEQKEENINTYDPTSHHVDTLPNVFSYLYKDNAYIFIKMVPILN